MPETSEILWLWPTLLKSWPSLVFKISSVNTQAATISSTVTTGTLTTVVRLFLVAMDTAPTAMTATHSAIFTKVKIRFFFTFISCFLRTKRSACKIRIMAAIRIRA